MFKVSTQTWHTCSSWQHAVARELWKLYFWMYAPVKLKFLNRMVTYERWYRMRRSCYIYVRSKYLFYFPFYVYPCFFCYFNAFWFSIFTPPHYKLRRAFIFVRPSFCPKYCLSHSSKGMKLYMYMYVVFHLCNYSVMTELFPFT